MSKQTRRKRKACRRKKRRTMRGGASAMYRSNKEMFNDANEQIVSLGFENSVVKIESFDTPYYVKISERNVDESFDLQISDIDPRSGRKFVPMDSIPKTTGISVYFLTLLKDSNNHNFIEKIEF